MDWETFYDRFYNWNGETQARRINDLEEFGPSDEVSEIAFAFEKERAAERFLKEALDAGVLFTPDDITELVYLVSPEVHPKLLSANSLPYTKENMEDLLGWVDEDLVLELCRQEKVSCSYLEELEELEREEKALAEEEEKWKQEQIRMHYRVPKDVKPGSFSEALYIWEGFKRELGFGRRSRGWPVPKKKEPDHEGCAESGDHYGYRYGRWYYGHGHQHGCECGGDDER